MSCFLKLDITTDTSSFRKRKIKVEDSLKKFSCSIFSLFFRIKSHQQLLMLNTQAFQLYNWPYFNEISASKFLSIFLHTRSLPSNPLNHFSYLQKEEKGRRHQHSLGRRVNGENVECYQRAKSRKNTNIISNRKIMISL